MQLSASQNCAVAAFTTPNCAVWLCGSMRSNHIMRPTNCLLCRSVCGVAAATQNWLFGPAWSVFYTSMGVASWFVLKQSEWQR
jgi:hypothetical protein